ncbi:MAG: hypothetical protein D6785_05695 [Planctomycetota bacterium]|nr:MAG: hypothetical protein D6785_05695 [Planctomycetota bacterium]
MKKRNNPFIWLEIAIFLIAITSSLLWINRIPGLNGDEARFGKFSMDYLHGVKVEWVHIVGKNKRTMDPIIPTILILAHSFLKPAPWVLRISSLLSYYLTILLVILLGRRIFSKGEEHLLALLLATCPMSLIYARFGWEASQAMLFYWLAFYFTYQKKLWPLPLLFALLIILHPTHIFFIFPLMAFYCSREWEGKRKIPWKPLLSMAVFLGGIFFWLLYKTPPLRSLVWTSLSAIVPAFLEIQDLISYIFYVFHFFSGQVGFQHIAGIHFPLTMVLLEVFLAFLIGYGIWKKRKKLKKEIPIIAWTGGFVFALFLFYPFGKGILLYPPPKMSFERYIFFSLFPFLYLLVWLFKENKQIILILSGVFLISFWIHYFLPLLKDGGNGFKAFRTGKIEPKYWAFQKIKEITVKENLQTSSKILIITEDWWTYWPLAYYFSSSPNYKCIRRDKLKRNEFFHYLEKPNPSIFLVAFAKGKMDKEMKLYKISSSDKVYFFPDPKGRTLLKLWFLKGKE